MVNYINKIESKFDSVKIRLVELKDEKSNYYIKLRREELNQQLNFEKLVDLKDEDQNYKFQILLPNKDVEDEKLKKQREDLLSVMNSKEI